MPTIDWSATGADALAQCVACLLATPAGTVPLTRALGVEHGIGERVTVAKARMASRIADSFARYEPRVKLSRVAFAADAGGTLRPTVTWRPA
jgi:phage baseplate assembly protein W